MVHGSFLIEVVLWQHQWSLSKYWSLFCSHSGFKDGAGTVWDFGGTRHRLDLGIHYPSHGDRWWQPIATLRLNLLCIPQPLPGFTHEQETRAVQFWHKSQPYRHRWFVEKLGLLDTRQIAHTDGRHDIAIKVIWSRWCFAIKCSFMFSTSPSQLQQPTISQTLPITSNKWPPTLNVLLWLLPKIKKVSSNIDKANLSDR